MSWEEIQREYINCSDCGAKMVKHVYKDGARYHVISWSTTGRKCSELDCEINHICNQSSKGE